MRIKKLQFEGHPILGSIELDFTDPTTGRAVDAVVIAGENGCGKTTILEEIYNLLSKASPQRKNKATIELELDQGNAEDIKSRFKVPSLDIDPDAVRLVAGETGEDNWNNYRFEIFDRAGTPFDRGAYEYFQHDANGSVPVPFRVFFSEALVSFEVEPSASVTALDVDQAISSRRGGTSLAKEISQLLVDIRVADNEDMAQWVAEHSGQAVPDEVIEVRVKRFKDAVSFMFPQKRLSSVQNRGGYSVQFEEAGVDTSINELSMGEKQVVFRGGFILRDRAAIQGGVVLVDEPELGLHPDWQARIIDFYRKLLPEGQGRSSQFIFATHSPFIVHNGNTAKVIVLRKEGSEIVVVAEPSYPVAGSARVMHYLNIDSILSSADKNLVVFVEGDTDASILKEAYRKLYPSEPIFFDVRSSYGDSALRTLLNTKGLFGRHPGKKLVGIFDFDRAFDQWKGVWGRESNIKTNLPSRGVLKKHDQEQGWALLLPVPDFRSSLASCELGGRSVLCVELLFKDEDHLPGLVQYVPLPATNATVPQVCDSKKVDFASHVTSLEVESFEAFRPIFECLHGIARE
ncbi:ATP-binding protein [Frateuria sp. Soil773]|uniref:AAA family ATPase n=1 Tax=Frateuria sp. Soil773 TaxID=1736407 RepID=UPI0009E7A94A|nr:ATP-binding protein [Frateuria sp. Soil773]